MTELDELKRENAMSKVVRCTIWSNPAYMKANERERMEAWICEYEGECPMYKQGKCVCENLLFGWIKCPHSKMVTNRGLTKRSKGFGKAATRWREQYKTEIAIENKVLCECGDYIYLPYPHLDVYGDKVIDSIIEKHFIKKEEFTVQTIRRIVKWQPKSLMGGILENFQRTEVPKFIHQLHDVFPDLYSNYLENYPDNKEMFDSICVNYVGRKAYLNTMKDGTTYTDCHGNIWVKQNGFLVCENMVTFLHFPIGRKPRKVMQQLVGDEIITVSNNDDVSENTVFSE